jgi:hypothetical protein
MHAVATAYQEIINKTAGLSLLGEIITWDLKENTRIRYADLLQSLNVYGLDEKVLRQLAPRYAWARAAKKMMDSRIIRQVAETPDKLAFQFTKEYKDSQQEQMNYDREAKLILEKSNGDITVESDILPEQDRNELASKASQLLAEAMDNRTTADVTNVIKRLFERHADLFPVRAAGSVYFVPVTHSEFVDRVQGFVNALEGTLNRFPIPAGTKHGDTSVKQAVTNGMQQLVQEYQDALETYGTDTRPSTVTKALERLETTEFKIETYKMYLEDEAANLNTKLEGLRQLMKQKLADILTARKEKNA